MKKHLLIIGSIFVFFLQACGAQATQTEQPAVQTSAIESTPTLPPIIHNIVPSEGTVTRSTAHDNEESATSGNKDVLFGDDFQNNRFERPFTANDMAYLPDLDIVDFSITSDDTFFYIRITFADVDLASQSLTGFYGVEFDKNSDGRAEIFLATKPPYNTEFTADNVYLFIDANGDVGGEQAASADPAAGDGFDSVLFDLSNNIHPEDPDLAWVRFVNDGKPAIEIAYKQWLFKDGNENFMWSVTASDALIDPALYNFHDSISEADAGSPTKASANYPITGLAAVDNTCRVPFGFQATGREPLGCSVNSVVIEAEGEPVEFCAQFSSACERLPAPPLVIEIIPQDGLFQFEK